VYVTGRTTGAGERTIDTTARQVTAAGGDGRAIRCDHGDDTEIAYAFARIGRDVDHIDYPVNNVYMIPDPPRGAAVSGITRFRFGTIKSASTVSGASTMPGTARSARQAIQAAPPLRCVSFMRISFTRASVSGYASRIKNPIA
jgi:hypothetical protein